MRETLCNGEDDDKECFVVFNWNGGDDDATKKEDEVWQAEASKKEVEDTVFPL